MPIESRPVFHTTDQIIERLQTLDREHPVTRTSDLNPLPQLHEQGFIGFQVESSIKYTVEKMPEHPTLADAKRALGSLVRTVDHGGRLHATLTHALGISRPASMLKPFPSMPDHNRPAVPERNLPAINFPPIRSRRELAVVLHTHDAVGRALEEFRVGVSSDPYRLERNPFDHDHPQLIRFIGDLLGRADVLDTLARAKSQLVELRAEAETKQTTFHDTSSIEINADQTRILNEVARGFVTELVRSTQAVLRESRFAPERASVLVQHVDAVMQEISASKDPLRFATSWVTDEHYPPAHRFMGELPSFQHKDVQPHETYARFLDHSLLQHLQENGYPAETALIAMERERREDQAWLDAASSSAGQSSRQTARRDVPRAATRRDWAASHPAPNLPERSLLKALRGISLDEGTVVRRMLDAAQPGEGTLLDALSRMHFEPTD